MEFCSITFYVSFYLIVQGYPAEGYSQEYGAKGDPGLPGMPGLQVTQNNVC